MSEEPAPATGAGPSPTALTPRGGCLRTIATALAGVCVVALFVLRLGRVPRTRFEPTRAFGDSGAAFGRVVLARRGQAGRTIGWAVVCAGREVLSLPGEIAPAVQDIDARSVRVRGFVVTLATCGVRAE